MEKLTIAIDHTAVESTTEAFDKLRASIEAVNVELEKLGDKAHGGITISAVGSLLHVEIAPAKAP